MEYTWKKTGFAGLIRWFLVERWYFRESLKSPQDYIALWNSIKPDGVIRRDIGRMLVKQSKRNIA